MPSQDETSEPSYILKNEEEMRRLSNQHLVIKQAGGGQLLFVPLDLSVGGLRVLDSGTADGTWILDVHSQAPGNTFLGTDIDATKFPTQPPEAVTFQVQDIRAPWPEALNESFDLVHQRLVLPSAGAFLSTAVKSLCGLVKKGGWIQLIESEYEAEDVGPALKNLNSLIKDIFKKMGASASMAQDIAPVLKEEGFVDIQDKIITMRLGKGNPDEELGRIGVHTSVAAATGLSGFAKTLPPESLSISQESLGNLVSDLKKELTERGGEYDLRITWGRKV